MEDTEEKIKEILKELKTRKWHSPEEVEIFFEESLRKVAGDKKKVIL